MIPQKEAVKLIRDAHWKLGHDALEALLPRPLHLSVCAHDTGCQPRIEARGAGLDRLLIWQGSIWFDPCYEINDRGKVLGMQAACEWAQPIIDKFFTDLRERIAEHDASAAITRAVECVSRDRKHADTVAAYRKMLGA